jgi:hypothetical protein
MRAILLKSLVLIGTRDICLGTDGVEVWDFRSWPGLLSFIIDR